MICDGKIRPGIAVSDDAALPAFLRGQDRAKIHRSPETGRRPHRRAGPGLVLLSFTLSMIGGFQAARLMEPDAPPLSLAVHPVQVEVLAPAPD